MPNSTNNGRLAGKVAIITGASTGCGPVMARLFIEQGARVLLAARREELVLEAAKAAGEGAIGMQADVTKEDDVRAMVDRAMQEFGQVDIMLNNAAAPGQDKWVWEQTLENFNNTIAIDLTAAMLCTREVLNRSMLERKTGTIINFSSTAGWMGMVRKTHYTSAKAALRALDQDCRAGSRAAQYSLQLPGARQYRDRTVDELGQAYGGRTGAGLRDLESQYPDRFALALDRAAYRYRLPRPLPCQR